MIDRRLFRILSFLSAAMLSAALQGCGLIEAIAGPAAEGYLELCEVPALLVTKPEDTLDGICNERDCSLRDAVFMANECEGEQTIALPLGSYALTRTGTGENGAQTGDLDITDDLIITGENAYVSGELHDSVFHVLGEGTRVEMSGVTIQFGSGAGLKLDRGTTVRLVTSVVERNDGGGVSVATGANLEVIETTLRENIGGAIFNDGNTRLIRSTLSWNRLGDSPGGAAVTNWIGATVSLENVTVSGNTGVEGVPQGVFFNAGDITFMSSTVFDNVLPAINQSSDGLTSFENTIVINDVARDCVGGGVYASGGHNFFDDFNCGYEEGLADLIHFPTRDPGIGHLLDNGGPTFTHALLPGSPAIDAASDDCPATDQRGVSRPFGDACDIGAYEADFETVSEPILAATPEDTPTPTPTPTVTPTALAALSINFNADSYAVKVGECTTLRWQVENANEVSLEGQQVKSLDARQVCPQKTTSYKLLATSPGGEQEARVTIEVERLQPPAAPTKLAITGRVCTDTAYSVTLGWKDNAGNEDGYRVYREAQLIATLGKNATKYTDNPPGSGPYTYSVEAFNSAGASGHPSVQEVGCLY
ncbi:MAG: hypothetical protein GTO14_16590 [Anaerolineales bacterium]|nr:hypothetical protein [Anaerolineales bacterium]